jgi:hemerythrin superfamily protein
MRTASRLPAAASTSGTGDALDLLERDHRRVEALFARSALVTGQAWRETVARIVHELTVHGALEEQVVYPAVADVLGTGGSLIDEAIDDHAEIKALVARLKGARGEDAQELDDLRRLQLTVQQHVTIEEGEVFPAYRRLATDEALRELDASAADARGAAPTPPDPDGDAGLEVLLADGDANHEPRTLVTGNGDKVPRTRRPSAAPQRGGPRSPASQRSTGASRKRTDPPSKSSASKSSAKRGGAR